MASSKEAKIVFKAVTDQFDSGINKAKSTVSGLNASLRLNAQQMQASGSTAQLMEQRVGLLTQKEREQQAVVDNLQSKLDAARFAYGENSDEVQKLNTQLTSSKATLQSYSNQVEQAKQKLAQSKTAYGQTSQAIEKQEAELKNLKQQYANVVLEQGKGSSAARELKSKIQSLSTELGQNKEKLQLADQAADRLGDSYMTAAEKTAALKAGVENVGSGLQTAGTALSATVTPAILAAGGAAVKMGMDFEDGLAKVSTIADATEVPMEDMHDAIVELSNDTGKAVEVLSDSVYNAISAGQKTGDAVQFVGKSAKLAKAGFAEESAALDVLTTTLNAYSLGADQATRVSDVLIMTQNKGKTTVGELSAQMGKAIPTASAFKVNLENLAAAYATTTAKGIATAESTTYINGMINELGDTGSEVGKIVKDKLGASFSDAMASGMSLGDALSIVQQSADESGKTMFDLFGSAEAAKAAFAIAGEGADGFNANLEAMNGSAGATDEAFDKMKTKSYEVELAVNRAKNAAIELGDALMDELGPMLDDVGDTVEDATEWFSNLDDEGKQLVIQAAAMAAAAGPVTLAIGKLATATGAIIDVAGKAKTSYGNFMTTLAASSAKTGAAAKAAGVLEKGLKGATKAVPVLGAAFVAFEAVKFIAEIERANSEAGKLEKQFDENVKKTTAFAEAYQNATAKMPEASQLVSASGQTVEQLNATIDAAENGITEILQQALGEQRGLRDEDVESINGYNQQIADAYAEKTETYLTLMRTEATLTLQELREMSDEEIAQTRANIEAQGQAAIDAENESYSKRSQNLAQQYNSGLISESDYNAQSVALRQDHRDKVDAINQQTAETYSVIGESLSHAKEDAVVAFGEMTSGISTHMEEIGNIYSDNYGKMQEFVGNQYITKDEFISAWEAMSDGAINSAQEILTSAASVADSGGEMDDRMRIAVDSILLNFDDLKGGAGTAGRDAMIQLANGMEEKLSGISDWSAMSADEIVEAIKTHLNLGDISRDEVQKYVDGIKSGQEFARASSEGLANAVKDPLSTLPDFAQRASEESTLLMANGISVGSENVRFEAGSLAEQVWSDLTGKDYSEAGAVVPRGIVEGMKDGVAVKLKAAGLGDDVIEAIMEALDAHSPSRRAATAGETVPAGLAQGIRGSDEPGTAAASLGKTVIDSIGSFIGDMFGIGAGTGGEYASGIGSQTDNADAQGRSVAGGAASGLSTGDGATPGTATGGAFAAAIGGQAGNANTQGAFTAGSAASGLGTGDGSTPGSSLGRGFASGVGGQSGSARTQGSIVASAAGGGLKSNSGSASSWGGHLVQNFAAGISGAIDWARSAASAVAGVVAGILGHTVPKEGILREGGKGEAVWGEHLVRNIASGMRAARPEIEREADEIAGVLGEIGKSPAVIDFSAAVPTSAVAGPHSANSMGDSMRDMVTSSVNNSNTVIYNINAPINASDLDELRDAEDFVSRLGKTRAAYPVRFGRR